MQKMNPRVPYRLSIHFTPIEIIIWAYHYTAR